MLLEIERKCQVLIKYGRLVTIFGHLMAILDFKSDPQLNLLLTYIKYVPIYMQKLNPITKILFEILSGNKNQRWLPGRHFGFPILSEIECDLHFHPSSTSVLNH